MPKRLTLLVCDYFHREVVRVVEEEKFGNVDVVAYTADCDHPAAVAKTLSHSLAELGEGVGSVCILGGHCLCELDQNILSEDVRFHPMEQCFELFLGPEQLDGYLKQGVHLVTPGMLNNWQAQYQKWGFDDADAKAFFLESTSRLLLLDTGIDPAVVEKLEAFADKAGLPWEGVNVGLDSLRLFLRALVAEWQRGKQQKEQNGMLQEKERQLADYAMVNDLISGITALTDEVSVVERVLELFTMFCGPGQVIYLPLSDEGPGEIVFTPPFSTVDDAETKRLADFTTRYQLDDKGGGFTLVIQRQGVRYGVVSVKDITFPEYRQHYLNLSLSITPVIALALSNARTYQKQVAAEERVKGLNQQLNQKLITVNALNKELEAFTYSVSHDLRAPLRSLDGFSRMLVRDYPDRLDDRGQHLLERVMVNAQRMGQLIDDMLRLSRLTRGELTLAQVDLSQIASAMAADLQQTAEERQVEFVVADGCIAQCDAGMLTIVLENLLGNAFKYTGKRAQAMIEFGATEAEGEATFFVRDNGAGFDMAYADKLFRPFQRLHTDEEFQGTGIGLATVQRIIQRHGGKLWAEGKPGEGAAFYFTL
ncbi:MAG: ATP-binding protein [Candidatus Sedimenticola sp. (ex Thyasira tokunagai)]